MIFLLFSMNFNISGKKEKDKNLNRPNPKGLAKAVGCLGPTLGPWKNRGGGAADSQAPPVNGTGQGMAARRRFLDDGAASGKP
jgi:hypothetical protein